MMSSVPKEASSYIMKNKKDIMEYDGDGNFTDYRNMVKNSTNVP
jgi:hypothetical protein